MGKVIIGISIALIATWTISIVSLNQSNLGDINFWFMAIWVNFLILVNVYLSFPILSNYQERNSNKLIGALPAINIFVFLSSVISGSLAFLDYFFFGNNLHFFNNYHFVIQTILVGFTITISLFLVLAAKGAEHSATKLITREDLIKHLNNFIIKNEGLYKVLSIKVCIDNLIDYISYKMPHPSSLNRDEYIKISVRISNIDKLQLENKDLLHTDINELLKKIKTL
tara:strand:+ start:1430 stop:2107 length:678 start_codon:yes stop_codon:yes gene_type:complete